MRHLRDRIAAVAAATILAAGLAGAASAETLMLANSDALGSITDRMNWFFKEDLERRSGGAITVNYVAGQSLGSAPQVTDQMIAGTVESFGNVIDWFAPLERDFQVFAWGFTFRDDAHLQAFLDSPRFAEMADRVLANHGVRILAAAPSQSRVLFSTRPITSADDLVGLSMRVPQLESYLELWTALGTRPTQVPWGEVFLALRTGLVAAAEGPVSGAYAQRFHEAAPEITVTNHVVSVLSYSINEARFQRMSPQHREWVVESARAAVEWGHQQSVAETEAVFAKMVAEGARLHRMDVAALQARALAAVERLEEKGLWSKGLWAEIQALP